jgi:hypothetical protein
MGKKPQRHNWPVAKKLCRLNQDDIEMAKRLGFGPDSLIRARPDPKQKWKLPVKYWIHELHFKRFGHVIGEQPLVVATPAKIDFDEEAARRFGEEMFWDDYYERNSEDSSHKGRKKAARAAAGQPMQSPPQEPRPAPSVEITDEDVPF